MFFLSQIKLLTSFRFKSAQRDEWMDFGAYVSGRSFESKDLVREKDKKKAAKEEEDKLRYFIWLFVIFQPEPFG